MKRAKNSSDRNRRKIRANTRALIQKEPGVYFVSDGLPGLTSAGPDTMNTWCFLNKYRNTAQAPCQCLHQQLTPGISEAKLFKLCSTLVLIYG